MEGEGGILHHSHFGPEAYQYQGPLGGILELGLELGGILLLLLQPVAYPPGQAREGILHLMMIQEDSVVLGGSRQSLVPEDSLRMT